MVYFSRRQCSNPDDCAETPSPTVERVLNTMAPSSAPDDHKILRAYVVLAANLILFLALARAGYRALTRPRAAPPVGRGHHRRNSSYTKDEPNELAYIDILVNLKIRPKIVKGMTQIQKSS